MAGATQEAWSHVMHGCAAALTVDGLPDDEAARLLRCLRLAAKKAERRALTVAPELPSVAVLHPRDEQEAH